MQPLPPAPIPDKDVLLELRQDPLLKVGEKIAIALVWNADLKLYQRFAFQSRFAIDDAGRVHPFLRDDAVVAGLDGMSDLAAPECRSKGGDDSIRLRTRVRCGERGFLTRKPLSVFLSLEASVGLRGGCIPSSARRSAAITASSSRGWPADLRRFKRWLLWLTRAGGRVRMRREGPRSVPTI